MSMYINRSLETRVKKLIKEYPIVVVTGPRQSGKTTMIKKLFPKRKYVSLENIDTRRFAIDDPRGFLEMYSDGVIIDEVQNAPELFSYLQEIVDTNNQMGEFILTGSQNFLLMEKINQSLAGRVAIATLLPLSIKELKDTKFSKSSLDEYILRGLYPRMYNSKIDAQEWYNNYIKTYIEKDVRMMKNIGDLIVFQKFIKLCAARVGQILNLSSIANDLGITHNTVKEWISILEASYIVFLLQPYHNNFDKRLIKMPKMYFYDQGLLAALLDIDTIEDIKRHPFRGGIFESFVITEIVKNKLNIGRSAGVYFWRDKIGREIDCIFEDGMNRVAIEIKSSQTVSSDFFKNLEYLQDISHNHFSKLFLVYNGKEEQKGKSGHVINWKEFLMKEKL